MSPSGLIFGNHLSGGFGFRTHGGSPKSRRCYIWCRSMKTNVYIDGFNLYYGCLKGTPHKWLNLELLFDALLPRNEVARILYFTARVEARDYDLDLPIRQMTYLRALATLPRVEVHFGTFMANSVKLPLLQCGADFRPIRQNNQLVVKTRPNGHPAMKWVYRMEEKGSDVNLASHLLRDAYTKNCECAIIVSNDSDLLTPIRMAKNDTGMIIGLFAPRQHGSLELRSLATFQKHMKPRHFQASQFPETFNDSTGTITKPAGW